LLGGYSTSASVRRPLFFTSPRPTGSTLLSRLRSTSFWSALRPSLKVCWLHLIPIRSAVLQATIAPCLHFKPLNLLSRDLMFAFIHAQDDFLFFFDPRAPYMTSSTPHLRFTSRRHEFVSAASPTRPSGAFETWVPTGPHRLGSQPSPTGGPDLSVDPAPPDLWAQRREDSLVYKTR
jgi:hypothetical protein